MISMMYFKKPGGIVKVHDREAVENIVDECVRVREQLELKKNQQSANKTESRECSANSCASTLSTSTKSYVHKPSKAKDWLNEKTIKELQSKASSECRAAKRLYSPLLETERTFVKELNDYLLNKEFTDLRKKEILHKKWSDQVYRPIRKKITEAVDRSDRHIRDYQKREMHRQFLEHVNKRGFVFLNDDDKEQYYAQALNDHHSSPVKVKTGNLRDPLLVQSSQRLEEDGTILRCLTGNQYSRKDLEQIRLPPLPRGHHRTGCSHWSEISYSNIDNMPKDRSRNWQWGNSSKTNIDLGAWAVESYDPKVAAQELRISHKRMFTEQPPYGKSPVKIPHVPFIDPDDFSDKIVNVNPFPQHMENLKVEDEAAREFFLQQQQCMEELSQQQMLSEDNKIQKQSREVGSELSTAVNE